MKENDTIKGRIHSFESMGLVDGPGVRFVVFFQGCKLRCSFCHNPDTWCMSSGSEITAKELFEKIKRYKPYYDASGGGVTFSGGEPLMQPEFLSAILKLCKAEKIHTVIDTSGVSDTDDYTEILSLADMVILDVKHLDATEYKGITGQDISMYEKFAAQLRQADTDVWLRAVIVPTINDNIGYINKLTDYAKTFPNIKKAELLPYHTLGVNKYKELGIKYNLSHILPMDKSVIDIWQEKIDSDLSHYLRKFS